MSEQAKDADFNIEVRSDDEGNFTVYLNDEAVNDQEGIGMLNTAFHALSEQTSLARHPDAVIFHPTDQELVDMLTLLSTDPASESVLHKLREALGEGRMEELGAVAGDWNFCDGKTVEEDSTEELKKK